MADPFRFLTSFAQALSTMALYANKHPARERAVDRSFSALRELQADDPKPQFSFLGEETVYGQLSLRDLREWEWANRLGDAGIQRLEPRKLAPPSECGLRVSSRARPASERL